MSFSMPLGMTVEEAMRAMNPSSLPVVITPDMAQQEPEVMVRDGVARKPKRPIRAEN